MPRTQAEYQQKSAITVEMVQLPNRPTEADLTTTFCRRSIHKNQLWAARPILAAKLENVQWSIKDYNL